jgi:hypothetical protein
MRSMHYKGAGNWLKPIHGIQVNALIVSVSVLSDLVICSIGSVPQVLTAVGKDVPSSRDNPPTCLAADSVVRRVAPRSFVA